MSKEIWKTVPSEPGLMVSSRGRIRIAPYYAISGRGGLRPYKGNPRNGEWNEDEKRFVFVWKRTGKSYKVARLVCEAFNGPPTFKEAVCMHVDENGKNNSPQNLKWGTHKENSNAPGYIDFCRSRRGEKSQWAIHKNRVMARMDGVL